MGSNFVLKWFVLGGGHKILNGCGKGKADIDLRAESGADFYLPDLTYILDVLVVLFFVPIFELLIIRMQVKIMGLQASS